MELVSFKARVVELISAAERADRSSGAKIKIDNGANHIFRPEIVIPNRYGLVLDQYLVVTIATGSQDA